MIHINFLYTSHIKLIFNPDINALKTTEITLSDDNILNVYSVLLLALYMILSIFYKQLLSIRNIVQFENE